MILITGLGNPGKEFLKTRHNVGFDIVDSIHSEFNFPEFSENFGKLNSECIESIMSKPTLCLVFKNSLPGLPSPVIKII